LAAYDRRPGPKFETLGSIQHGLVERLARRDAAEQIRKPDTYGLAFRLFDDGDIMGHASVQSVIIASPGRVAWIIALSGWQRPPDFRGPIRS
jgi:hypothetical protein